MTQQMFTEDQQEQDQKRRVAEQDVRINETINGTLTMFDNIRKNPEIAAILAEHGYDEQRLSEGQALCETTRQGFHQRGTALTSRYSASAELNGREQTARQKYSDFRLAARGLFPEETSHSELALSGEVPQDRTKFLGIARMSVEAVRREPYVGRFAEFGWNTDVLDSIISALDAVDDADSTQNNAILESVEATKTRDEAFAALSAWLQLFRRIATAALRSDPEKLKILEA